MTFPDDMDQQLIKIRMRKDYKKMGFIKLHYYAENCEDPKEIIVNPNAIFKMEKGVIFFQSDKKLHRCTDVYLNEYVSKAEPKKLYKVVEDMFEICTSCEAVK